MGLVDTRFRPRLEAGRVLVPVLDAEGALGAVREFGGVLIGASALDDAVGQEAPFDAIFDILASTLSPEELTLLPDRWELYGHVAVVKLHPRLVPKGEVVGRAIADALGVETVLDDFTAIGGTAREPAVRILHGHDTETIHREHGVLYKFDVARVMFASGNKEERRRMGELDCAGETVVDMFAGIGYFAIPVAKFAKADQVVAAEMNPTAHSYLKENSRLNAVEATIDARLGDNRAILPDGIADRVIMGFVGTTHEYLDKAMTILSERGGTIHYHESCPEELVSTRPATRVSQAAARNGRRIRSIAVRRVKSFSPGVSHVVADAELE
ncbi:MAG: class I SAM-dependent methyltransferase family protein [Euryarchaeota archaeon]|nr:class I SAM-dependent methyltransferase family protein [Euryarchaeota archaeon]